MRFILVFAALLSFSNAFAKEHITQAQFQACDREEQTFIKKLFDTRQISLERSQECKAPGSKCTTYRDCCGMSMCNSGFCSIPDGECVNPGTRCESYRDCCGMSMCNSGYCSATDDMCVQPGGHCESYRDCCGMSMCNSGYCSATDDMCVQPGGHCESYRDCCGMSMCSDEGYCD